VNTSRTVCARRVNERDWPPRVESANHVRPFLAAGMKGYIALSALIE